MPENLKKKEGIESRRDAREPEIKKRKVSNLGVMSENLNQKEGIESSYDAGAPEIKKEGIKSRSKARELETKLRDRIRVRCVRTQNKTKESNPEAMPEKPKQKEGIESGCDAGEPEIKGRDKILARCQKTRKKQTD